MYRAYEVFNGDAVVTYSASPETHMKVMDKIVEYFSRNDVTCPEAVMQNDDANLEAPELLSDIAEMLIEKTYWSDGTKEE